MFKRQVISISFLWNIVPFTIIPFGRHIATPGEFYLIGLSNYLSNLITSFRIKCYTYTISIINTYTRRRHGDQEQGNKVRDQTPLRIERRQRSGIHNLYTKVLEWLGQ